MAKNTIKITTKVAGMKDVQKALLEIEKQFNMLVSQIHSPAEKELPETTGKTGDIQIVENVDKSYTFELKTNKGWRIPYIGDSPIVFKSKSKTNSVKKSIDEIEADDTNNGGRLAKTTIYDEKEDKFVLPRPDYDSGWQAIDNSTHLRTTAGLILTHNIGAMPKLVQLFCSEDNAEDEYHGTLYGLVENHSHGVTYLVNSSTITIWTGDTGIFRLVHGSGTNTDVTSGYIRAMIWK